MIVCTFLLVNPRYFYHSTRDKFNYMSNPMAYVRVALRYPRPEAFRPSKPPVFETWSNPYLLKVGAPFHLDDIVR